MSKATEKTAKAMAAEIFLVVEPLLHGWERKAAYEEFFRICKDQLEQIEPKPIRLEPSRN